MSRGPLLTILSVHARRHEGAAMLPGHFDIRCWQPWIKAANQSDMQSCMMAGGGN
jgi:hypothetical protein